MTKRTSALAAFVALLLGASVLGACGEGQEAGTAVDDLPVVDDDNAPIARPGDSADEDAEVDAPSVLVFFVRDEKLVASARPLRESGPARSALRGLLEQPTAAERDLGMSSAIPAGTELVGIDITEGVATVDLDGTFQEGGGSASMRLRVAQIVWTVSQIQRVRTVDITIGGSSVEGIGGEGMATTGLTRGDFEDLLPMILVEHPTPMAVISAPITLSGLANTFESNIRWSAAAADGTPLDEGFTLAGAGPGSWGPFSVGVDLGTHTGDVTLRVWEDDPATGDEINVVEVPVVVR